MKVHLLTNTVVCGLMTSAVILLPATAAAQGTRNPPQAPVNLQCVPDGQSNVNLTWTDQSTNELGFRIIRERQLGGSAWGEAEGFTAGANATSFLDSPSPGVYRYRVRAYNQKGNSSYTPRVQATVSAASQIPATPSGLAVQDIGGGQARLTWTDTSSNEAGFDIERQPAFTGGAQRVGANVVSFVDPAGGGMFAYRLRATNPTGSSSFTPWFAASIQPASGSGTVSPFPALIPRSGFTGPTPQPPAVGNPSAPGYDAKAIARWDVVPFQTITSDFNVGVVAFHFNGIDRVDFSANGGPWVSVREMALNPQSGVREYTARLRATDLSDGIVEIRAIVWPVVGEPRVLGGALAAGLNTGEHSMFLTSNTHNTLPTSIRYVSPTGDDSGDGSLAHPLRTIMKAAKSIGDAQGGLADGGVIYLTAGDHVLGTYQYSMLMYTRDRWLTIAPTPGLDRSQVRIIRAGPDGLRTKLVRLSNLTLAPATGPDQTILTSNVPLEDYIWADSCDFVGPGRTVSASWGSGLSANFLTDCLVRLCRDAPGGAIMRNVIVRDIGSDALSGTALAVNCTVFPIDSSGTEFHADILQYYSGSLIQNQIAYGIIANTRDGQGFFAGNAIALKDIAFVDCEIDNQYGGSNIPSVFMFGGPVNHMVVRNSVFVGPSFWRTDFAFTAHNILLEGNCANHARTQVLLPSPDRTSFPGSLPWTSPISVRYR